MMKSSTILTIIAIIGASAIIEANAAERPSWCAKINPSDRHYLRKLEKCRAIDTDILPVTKSDGGLMDVVESGFLTMRDAQDIELSEMNLDEKSILEALFWQRDVKIPDFPYYKYPWARYIDTRTPIYAIDYNDQLLYIVARDETSVTLGHNRA